MGDGSKRPCCGMVHPDTGERRERLACWAEVYDMGGRLLGLLITPTAEYVEDWARSRPAGSRYRVIVRGGGRALVRLEMRVHPGRLVEVTGSKVGGGNR